MPLIGYARVSTEEQTPCPSRRPLNPQAASRSMKNRPLAEIARGQCWTRVLERIGKGDTLVVVRIDRLARSLSHLLEVIERLEAKRRFLSLD